MRRRVLLADDSVTIQKVIELTFMDEDYEVRAVSNGDDAIRALSEVGPDFVIADVHMPGANGYEVCRRSKASRPHVPVLLLVGTFEPFDEGQARSAGADSFLKKPFDSQELLQRVGDLLAARPAEPMLVPEPAHPTPVEEWRGFELEPDPDQPSAPAAASPYGEEQAFVLEEPSHDWQGGPSYLPDGEPMFELDAEPEPATPQAAGGDVFGFEAEPPLAPVPDFAALSPSENQLTDNERMGVPEDQAPLVDSFEETERRIEAPAPASVLESHEPQAPAKMATPEPAMHAMPATPSLTDTPHVGNGSLSDADVDRIARRVVELLGDKAVRDVAWEVVPDLAEVVIRDRLRELESQAENLE